MREIAGLLNPNRFESDRTSQAVRRGLVVVSTIIAISIINVFILPSHVPPGELVFGAIIGTVYALIAIGLILIYKANRIINFAVAEFGVLGAIVYQNLLGQSKFPWILAVICGLASSVIASYLMERFIARRFSNSSRLILTVATIGMSQFVAFAEVEVSKHFGTIPASGGLSTPLSRYKFSIGNTGFDGNAILLVVVAGLIVAALYYFLYRNDFGIALRASAENAPRASLLGIPVKKTSTIAWCIAGLVVGLASILQAPMTGVVAGGSVVGPTLLFKALTVALIADFSNLEIAIFAGILLGIFEQSVNYLYSGSTITDALLVVVVLSTIIFKKNKTSRIIEGTTSSWRAIREIRRIPAQVAGEKRVRLVRLSGIFLAFVAIFIFPLLLGGAQIFDASDVVAFALVAISCVIVTGWSGQISLGQFAIAALGAVVSGKLFIQDHVDFIYAFLAAGAVGSLVSTLLGLIAIRVRGFLFAVSTLGFAIALESYFFNPQFFKYLIPSSGFIELQRPVLFGVFNLSGDRSYYYFSAIILVIVGYGVHKLRTSRTGRVLIAVKDNERAASSYGVSKFRSLMSSFALSGFVAGIGGCVYAFHAGAVIPGDFAANQSIVVFTMAVIGGLGSVAAASIGAIIIESWGFAFSQNQALSSLGTAAGLTLVLLIIPEGIGSLVFRIRDVALGKFSPDVLAQAPDGGQADLENPIKSVDSSLINLAQGNGSYIGTSGQVIRISRIFSGLDSSDPRLASLPPPPAIGAIEASDNTTRIEQVIVRGFVSK